MRVFTTIAGLRSYLFGYQEQGKTVGLVPTMGSLHQGHISLIQTARRETDVVVVSIFVNPLQFSPTEDLSTYPRQWEQDYQIAQSCGVDGIFAPSLAMMDGEKEREQQILVIPPANLTQVLCGIFRPDHFSGVATIVTKLLQIVSPNIAYFGEKDWQQLAIIRHLVGNLPIDVEIKGCPTVRESSGLAYSSRNQYLSVEARKEASLIFQALKKARHHFLAGERRASTLKALVREVLSLDAFRVQYVEVVHPQTLVPLEMIEDQGLLALAVYLGTTRLIDNILLRDRSMIIAIDGPAGAGKSTVTRQVAQRLGLMYLDTGAMYRALTWLVLQSGISPEDEAGVAELVSQATLELIPSPLENQPPTVIINGQDITLAIRTLDITRHVSVIAAQRAVRQVLLDQQQRYGVKGGIVVEGRDIATRVFPDAEVKIFLTASVSERAKRRYQDLIRQGEEDIDPLGLEREIAHRDYLDSHRSLSPLVKAEDAIEVNTDGLTIEQVIEKIVELSYSRSKL